MSRGCLFLILFLSSFLGYSQTIKISGFIPSWSSQELTLYKATYFGEEIIGKGKVHNSGHFIIECLADYKGIGYLKSNQGELILIVLDGNPLDIFLLKEGGNYQLSIEGSLENDCLKEGIEKYKYFFERLIDLRSLLGIRKEDFGGECVDNQINELEKDFKSFLSSLQEDSFCHTFLSSLYVLERLNFFNDIGSIREYKWLEDFSILNFDNLRIHNTGLYQELIFQLYLFSEENLLQEIMQTLSRHIAQLYLDIPESMYFISDMFDKFETMDLEMASESLAIALFEKHGNVDNAKINDYINFHKELSPGKEIADINFSNTNQQKFKSMHELKSEYTLLVFGMLECRKCYLDMENLNRFYHSFSEEISLSVVFHLLDMDLGNIVRKRVSYPWIITSDLKGWESEIVKSYYINSVPVYILMDSDKRVLIKSLDSEKIMVWLKDKGIRKL